ncbi:flagellar motor protein [Sulfoacidibacillus thermotolerans]|uniref:Motility protein A n=1 Tax=Sulfoacidibacillus thermotolerans TaxID=1765684 RepID=A0A2U3D8P7_SULT2|nr:flagellar motor protein [Sulfoacidibacillus thermotolerans]PWI57641.1 motility protein A [Sulfoacidibacillus thermotolerans]
MDMTTLIGLLLSFISLLVAFVMEGGSPLALFGLSAGLIVFGGTIGALIVSYPGAQLRRIPALFKIAFTNRTSEPLDTIDELVTLATIARREGILALEDKVVGLEDTFLKNGIQLVVDGVDPELVRSILETELTAMEERHETGAGMFEAAGGFAPTMGILGTVMGLIHVLSNLSDVSRLGPLIATAFIATLYGVGSANLIWLPIASKLKMRSKSEVTSRELIVEGVLSIQAGENPNTLRQKLQVFLAPGQRERAVTAQAPSGAAEVADM